MSCRDENGHFISGEEARRRGLLGEDGDDVQPDYDYQPTPHTPIQSQATRPRGSVWVDVGRGDPVEVPVGIPFVETLDRLAEQAHYGGDYRVFLNGSEIIYIEEAPTTIEAGMRLAITSYDKPGLETRFLMS